MRSRSGPRTAQVIKREGAELVFVAAGVAEG
jgi:hypothetical protein